MKIFMLFLFLLISIPSVSARPSDIPPGKPGTPGPPSFVDPYGLNRDDRLIPHNRFRSESSPLMGLYRPDAIDHRGIPPWVRDNQTFLLNTMTISIFNSTLLSTFPEESNLLTYIETPSYGGTIRSIAVTDTHIFYAGPTTQRVRGYNLETEEVDIETPSYGGCIFSIAVTDTHIFYGGLITQTVRGYNLETGLVDIWTPSYGGDIRDIAVTDTHIFYGGWTTQTVRGYNLETGIVDIETPSYGGTIWSIAVTDTHIFYGGETTHRVIGHNLTTEEVDIEPPSYGGNISAIAVTDTHIFYGGETTQTVRGYYYAEPPLPPEIPTLAYFIPVLLIIITLAIISSYAFARTRVEGLSQQVMIEVAIAVILAVAFLPVLYRLLS